MGILRDNSTKRQHVKDKTKALFSELLDLDEDYAGQLVEWYLEKTITNKKNKKEVEIRRKIKNLRGKNDDTSNTERKKLYTELSKVLPANFPQNLIKGDIIYVNYGQGYSGEISNGHYGVILKRKGNNYLIAPLTKTSQPDGTNTKILKDLGLPGKDGKPVKEGYINFGQIKFVDYRRLENVKGLTSRVNIAEELPDLLAKFNNIINS
ncbi:hypothetical protein [Lysinibacillus capsici]|uniref:hypothetical protein n=1 Tax=Lysinibacillus capsici TaxID=2115968 RepID=UPI0034E1DCE2